MLDSVLPNRALCNAERSSTLPLDLVFRLNRTSLAVSPSDLPLLPTHGRRGNSTAVSSRYLRGRGVAGRIRFPSAGRPFRWVRCISVTCVSSRKSRAIAPFWAICHKWACRLVANTWLGRVERVATRHSPVSVTRVLPRKSQSSLTSQRTCSTDASVAHVFSNRTPTPPPQSTAVAATESRIDGVHEFCDRWRPCCQSTAAGRDNESQSACRR